MLNILSRREVVAGIAVGVPLAAVLADPLLARAVAQTLETVTITTQGGTARERRPRRAREDTGVRRAPDPRVVGVIIENNKQLKSRGKRI